MDSKELILRDKLALDRTKLANQRTLLAFGRTGLYLIVTALAIFKFSKTGQYDWIAWCLIALGSVIEVAGIVNYIRMKIKINRLY